MIAAVQNPKTVSALLGLAMAIVACAVVGVF